jgi:hypothetical protein
MSDTYTGRTLPTRVSAACDRCRRNKSRVSSAAPDPQSQAITSTPSAAWFYSIAKKLSMSQVRSIPAMFALRPRQRRMRI